MALITAVLVSSLTLFGVPADTTAGSTLSSSAKGRRLFQVDKFVASPQVLSPSGRSPAYILPLPLPSDFEISLEIEASHSTLTRMSLAGYSLSSVSADAVPRPAQQDEASSASPLPRYRVRLRRAKGKVSLFVYDNDTFIVHNFHDEPVDAAVNLRAGVATVSDLTSGEKVSTTERKEAPRFGAPPVASSVAAFTIAPHSFRAFRIGE
jgi:hypothetical protein